MDQTGTQTQAEVNNKLLFIKWQTPHRNQSQGRQGPRPGSHGLGIKTQFQNPSYTGRQRSVTGRLGRETESQILKRSHTAHAEVTGRSRQKNTGNEGL